MYKISYLVYSKIYTTPTMEANMLLNMLIAGIMAQISAHQATIYVPTSSLAQVVEQHGYACSLTHTRLLNGGMRRYTCTIQPR